MRLAPFLILLPLVACSRPDVGPLTAPQEPPKLVPLELLLAAPEPKLDKDSGAELDARADALRGRAAGR